MRERIDASAILKRVQRHALGQEEMTATELQAARLLLGKTMPDLKAVEVQSSADPRSPHALPLADLLRVIDGEAQVVDSKGKLEGPAGFESKVGGPSAEASPPPEQKFYRKADLPFPTEAQFREGRVTQEEREAKREFLLKHRLPKDPPEGYRYGELSRNGDCVLLEKIEDSVADVADE